MSIDFLYLIYYYYIITIRNNMNNNIEKVISDNSVKLLKYTEDLLLDIKTLEQDQNSEGDISYQVDSWITNVSKLLLGEEFKNTNLRKEKTIRLSKLENRNHGEIDTFVNNIIIEYKRIGGLSQQKKVEKANTQIKDYLEEVLETEEGSDGISTDGKKVFLHLWNQELQSWTKEEHKFDEKILINKVIPLLFNVGKRKITTKNLVKDFLAPNNDMLNITNLSKTLYKQLTLSINSQIHSKTKMLYTEWKEVFKATDSENADENTKKIILGKRQSLGEMVADNINTDHKEYIALFSVYTAYSIFLKLVAYQVLCNIKQVQGNQQQTLKVFLEQLESNEIFSNKKILNLLDGDYFQWYVESVDKNKDLADRLANIKTKLSCYEVADGELYVADIFRNFYEKYIDFNIRHSLGEYFTPLWLADYCVKEFEDSMEVKKDDYKLIDNCCGSGAFLLAGINRKLAKGVNYGDILDSVVGIDINPLSALQARINYFIALSPKIKNIGNTSIVIPVYLADSCNVPTKDEKFVYYELTTQYKTNGDEDSGKKYNFSIPLKILNNKNDFFTSILNIEKIILSSSILDSDKTNLIYDELRSLVLPNANGVKTFDTEENSHVNKFISDLLELQNNKWNGIWARIIANRIFTVELEEKFDLVVGNPPWVKWGNLPAQYRKDLQEKADKYNLFSDNKFLGGNSLNICSLISYVSLKTYGNNESKLVYIMPSDMMFQPSYEAWRKLNQDQYFEKYISFGNKNVFKDVTMDFSIYLVNKSKKCDIVYNEVKLVKKNTEWDDIKTFAEIQANPNITVNTSTAKELILVRSDKTKFIVVDNPADKITFEVIGGKSEYKVRSGLGLLPKETRLFKLVSFDKLNKVAEIESLDSIKNNLGNIITINSDYLFPVLTSEDLSVGNVDLSNKNNYELFTFLPYDYQVKSKESFDISDLKTKLGNNFFNQYFLGASKKLSAQSQTSNQLKQKDSYGIARIGTYTYHPHKVILRDNTKFVSSVISKQNFYNTELQDRVPLLNSHVSSISERITVHGKKPKTTLITEEESLFINAILNLPIVRKFIENSNSPRGYELNDLGIFLPVFDSKNTFHQNILIQAKSSTPNQSQILTNYLEDCYLNNPYYLNRNINKVANTIKPTI